MLLYPTYNRSLKVGSNEGLPMTESQRRKISTIVYSYQVFEGEILPGSEKEHFGIKQLIRDGISSINEPNVIIPISYFDLSPLLKTGSLYKNRFVFSTERLVEKNLINWKPLASSCASSKTATISTLSICETSPNNTNKFELKKVKNERTYGVYVYKYLAHNDKYSIEDFIEFIPSVSLCSDKYKISKSHFLRLRRYNAPHNGYLFSNYKLH